MNEHEREQVAEISRVDLYLQEEHASGLALGRELHELP